MPVTDETLFQIGSITKTVTATAMMRLVEQGKLELKATVREYLPDFRVRDVDASARVTVWHLLTHLSGWTGDVFTDKGNNDDAAEKYVNSMAEFEQLAPLGTVFSYNNAAFCVAGRVIEVLTGETFEDAIRDLIFEPLGMERSFFFPHQAMMHRFAVGHQMEDVDGEPRVLSPWAIPRGMNAAGGISCHIQDLLRYGRYHLGDGPPLLRSDSLKQMHRPQVGINNYMGSVGLSWILNTIHGSRLLGHGGGTNGQNAILSVAPEHDLALGMMTNGDLGGKLNDRFQQDCLCANSVVLMCRSRRSSNRRKMSWLNMSAPTVARSRRLSCAWMADHCGRILGQQVICPSIVPCLNPSCLRSRAAGRTSCLCSKVITKTPAPT